MLTFKAVTKKDEALVLKWLHKPHVNEFFHGVGLQNTIDGLQRFVDNNCPSWQGWLGFHNNMPFAFLITSVVNIDNAESYLLPYIEPNDKSITLDLLIGEESYLGKGLAKKMIETFLQHHFSHIDKVFIDPEEANAKAIHVYEKAGFRKLQQFIASWHPVPHWLLLLEQSS